MKIDIHNYEDLMLSFVDNELSEEEAKALWLFLEQHPEQQAELKLLQAAKLPADEKIIFPDKNSLYRKEAVLTRKIFFLRRYPWLSAAAACLLLLIALFVHPWKEQVIPKETVSNTLPVQKNKAPVLAPANSQVKEIIHNDQVKQKETVAIHQAKNKNGTYSLPKTNKSGVLAKDLPEKKPGPVSPPTLPGVALPPVGENNVTALNENPLSGQLPLETAPHSMPVKEININNDNAAKNDEALIASNKPAANENIVQKVDEWRKKPAEVLENIHQNGIKIGKITIAFNN